MGDGVDVKIKRALAWIRRISGIVIGVIVIKTGFDFAGGSGAFAYREGDVFTGLFVMIVGVYFVFSSLFPGRFD